MIGLWDRLDHATKKTDELGMVTSDLLFPDPDEEHNLAPVGIRDGRSTIVLSRHPGAAGRSVRTARVLPYRSVEASFAVMRDRPEATGLAR